MKTSKRLFINTIILTLATFVLRSVDVSFNVYLTNKIGKAGIGLFSLILTVYAMAVTFSSGGIRLASARLTVEKENKNKILYLSLSYAFTVGLIIAVGLFFFSSSIARFWIKDLNTQYPLKILALSLPFVSMSSALSGYFTGRKIIARYSLITLLEQIIKILTVAISLNSVLQKGIKYSCCAVVLGLTAGEISSFILALILYCLTREKDKVKLRLSDNLKAFFHIALPDAFGSSARSVLLTIEHLLIPEGFRKAGQSVGKSLSTYGVIHGMALPVVLYPAAVLNSLSSVLIPEIAELKAKNQIYKIELLSEKIIKITLLFAFCVSGILFCFSDNIALSVYHNTDCSEYLQILSPLVLIMYLDTCVDAILKGLDQQVYSMRYNILDSLICVVLVYTLIPRYSISGYIFILFISEIINWALSLRRLTKVCSIRIDIKDSVIKPSISIILSFTFSHMFLRFMITSKISLALVILFTVLIYILLLILFGSISADDLKLFKSILKKG